MPSGSLKAHIKCPFYRYDDTKIRITCEGTTESNSISQTFHTKAEFKNYIRKYCCKSYKSCKLYELAMEKYKEDE